MARTLVCAHRGVSAYFPENTVTAIEEAARIGAPLCEIDVRRTKDGHLVLMHDETVDRTTSGTGAVTDLTLEEIRRFDAGAWKGSSFAGEEVPTLSDVLEVCRDRNLFLCIEIKQYDVAQDVASLVRNHGLQTGVVVISFSFDTVCDVRRADPSLATGWLTSHLNPKDVDEVVGRCLSAGIPTVSAHYPELTPETVDRCHLRGLTLYAWTIDDETVAQRYAAMGVDVIASNRPQEIMGALRD